MPVLPSEDSHILNNFTLKCSGFNFNCDLKSCFLYCVDYAIRLHMKKHL